MIESSEIHTTGGCACGAIRYAFSGKPVVAFNCHCRACQRATGSASSSVLSVPKASFRLVQGQPRQFVTTGDSGGKVHRHFCADCGSPVFSLLTSYSDITAVVAASLDDPSWHQPMADLFTANAQPWDNMDPALPKFAATFPG